MKEILFYGEETPDVTPKGEYKEVRNQRMMYELLEGVWSAETCAPRYRSQWSQNNNTVGQCSITAFLVQDVFGGKVYGVPLPEGGYHCYNEVDGVVFDLTSRQFGGRVLVYDLKNEQKREEHFRVEEKYDRYLQLRSGFRKKLGLSC